MNDYYDRNGEPLKGGDAVAALRGSEQSGYTAALFVVGIPAGHNTLMLQTVYPHLSCAEVYQYIPTDKAELERRHLTGLGPCHNIDLEKFLQWQSEVKDLPGVDSEDFQQLSFRNVLNPSKTYRVRL